MKQGTISMQSSAICTERCRRLMKEGDAAPGTLSKVLPLSRNVDALYDVLVHVVEAARVSAPGDQVGQLQQAMADLEKARVAFGNQLQQTADVQEKQIVDLRTTVQTQAASLKAAVAATAGSQVSRSTDTGKEEEGCAQEHNGEAGCRHSGDGTCGYIDQSPGEAAVGVRQVHSKS